MKRQQSDEGNGNPTAKMTTETMSMTMSTRTSMEVATTMSRMTTVVMSLTTMMDDDDDDDNALMMMMMMM
jgi:hypothetical protein